MILKEVLKSDGHRLHQKYEEKYKRDFEIPELEEKKRQLEEIRKFFKPIPKTELEEHAMRYERVRQSKNEESRKIREESIKAQKEHLKKLKLNNAFKLNVDQSTLESSSVSDEKLIEEKRKLLERVRSYAKNVKEMYWPKISEEKRSEMQHLRRDSSTKVFQRLRSSVLLPPGGYHRNI